tara:strand:- start:1303 stop:1713 length:411 start_codon:yes stop_codon:yes gene_type:complete
MNNLKNKQIIIINMRKSEIINKIHSILIFYCIFGFIFQSQRKTLLLFLPSLQYQFLVNDNNCILTQLENRLIKEEKIIINKKNDDKEEKEEKEEEFDSFIGSKLKQYNINIPNKTRENLIHTFLYGCFLINYFLYE